mgnify:CR=1 FL=1
MKGAISLGVGEPDFDTPWHIREEGIYSLEKGRTFYTSNSGLKELRQEICHYLKRRQRLEYDPNTEVMVTVGGSEAIDIALRAMLNPGDEVLIPQPSYVSYVPCTVLAGGTPVEAWMDRETMSGFKEFDLSFLDNPDQIDRPQYKPCGLYNGMIAPLVPYTVKGFLWYQGESNRPNPTQYRALMPAFVKMLRERWAQGELPFYYVQIAPYRYDGPDAISGALLREAQLHNLKDIPSSGMAVTLDIGDEGCIHPAKKEEVGTRLAWLALSKTYGMKGIDADTPVCEKMEVADGKAYLTFATGPDGLAPYGRTLTGFEMAGADRVFHPATARIEKGKSRLIVACDAVPEPVAVRYAFRNVPEATLFNTSGIPASSFRTDDWEVK